jgi:hypothetical protein
MDLTAAEERLTTFTQAVERVSALAHAKLPPELHGHLERATALVIHRHVWMDEDGRHGQVLSSDGQTWYVCNGHCTCMGVTHAPQGLCKHRLAVALYRRASELLAQQGGATPAAAAAALPEAPASVNVRLCVFGHECQFTMRDSDEARLVERLQALLARFPQQAKTTSEASAPASGETPTCLYHGAMRESTKVKGTFYCPSRMGDGTFCKEKFPKK